MIRLVLALMTLTLLGACTSIRTTDRDGKSYRYFGFVEVVVPKVERDIEAVKIESAGIALEKGLSVGWRENETVLVPLRENAEGPQPNEATCGIVVVVRSNAEAEQARDTLKDLKGDNICLATFQ